MLVRFDLDDLRIVAAHPHHIADLLPHEGLGNGRDVGQRPRAWVRFILTYYPVALLTPVMAHNDYRSAKMDHSRIFRATNDLCRGLARCPVAQVAGDPRLGGLVIRRLRQDPFLAQACQVFFDVFEALRVTRFGCFEICRSGKLSKVSSDSLTNALLTARLLRGRIT
jgi:hypothetical protein